MNKTKIEWCGSTWNPVTGCLHGCEYCYAEKIAERFRGEIAGKETVKRITIEDGRMIWELLKPVHKIDGKISPYPCGFIPTFHKYRLDDYVCKKGRNIFVCSMADLFGEWVPDEWIEEVFKACEKAPQHRYLFLTKNPQRYIDLAKTGKLPAKENMWYGSTITDGYKPMFYSKEHNCFVSIEPLLGNFEKGSRELLEDIRWVILGAMTGPGSKKHQPEGEWIENILEVADQAGVPVFMKNSFIPIVGEENMRREFPWEE